MEIIKKDTYFIITTGTWADNEYRIITLCKAKQDLDMDLLKTEYLEISPEQAGRYKFNQFKFTKWLLDLNIVGELNYAELQLTDYFDVDEMNVILKKKEVEKGGLNGF